MIWRDLLLVKGVVFEIEEALNIWETDLRDDVVLERLDKL